VKSGRLQFVIGTAALAAVLLWPLDRSAAVPMALVALSTVPTRQILIPAINAATAAGDRRRFAWLHGLSVLVTLAHIAAAGAVLAGFACGSARSGPAGAPGREVGRMRRCATAVCPRCAGTAAGPAGAEGWLIDGGRIASGRPRRGARDARRSVRQRAAGGQAGDDCWRGASAT